MSKYHIGDEVLVRLKVADIWEEPCGKYATWYLMERTDNHCAQIWVRDEDVVFLNKAREADANDQ